MGLARFASDLVEDGYVTCGALNMTAVLAKRVTEMAPARSPGAFVTPRTIFPTTEDGAGLFTFEGYGIHSLTGDSASERPLWQRANVAYAVVVPLQRDDVHGAVGHERQVESVLCRETCRHSQEHPREARGAPGHFGGDSESVRSMMDGLGGHLSFGQVKVFACARNCDAATARLVRRLAKPSNNIWARGQSAWSQMALRGHCITTSPSVDLRLPRAS